MVGQLMQRTHLSWQRAVARPVTFTSLQRAFPICEAGQIAEWCAVGQGNPVARAAQVLERVLAAAPRSARMAPGHCDVVDLQKEDRDRSRPGADKNRRFARPTTAIKLPTANRPIGSCFCCRVALEARVATFANASSSGSEDGAGGTGSTLRTSCSSKGIGRVVMTTRTRWSRFPMHFFSRLSARSNEPNVNFSSSIESKKNVATSDCEASQASSRASSSASSRSRSSSVASAASSTKNADSPADHRCVA